MSGLTLVRPSWPARLAPYRRKAHLAMQPRRHRRSALEAVSCPHRYHELYERPDPVDDTSDEAIRGSAFHDVAKVYIRRLASLGLATDHEELIRALHATIAVTKTPPHLVREVEDLAIRWGQRFELDLDAYLLAEETQVLLAEGVEWTPDLVYARPYELEQVDWKTYWVGLTDDQVKQQFQAQVYVWQASKVWPNFDQYRFTFSFPRLGYEATGIWYPEEIEQLEPIVTSRIGIIDDCRTRNEWPAIPGTHCGFCRLKCPKRDHMALEAQRATTDDQAAELAAELLVLDQAVTSRKKALKAWCKTEGPVNANGARFGFQTYYERRFLVQDVLKVLQGHGIEKPQFSVSASSLATYLKTKMHAQVAPELLAIATEKPRQQFRNWTPTDTAEDAEA